MGWKVVVSPQALAEMDEAISWYQEKSAKAASLLMSELANRFHALERNPFYTRRYKDIYCIPLKRFPYMLHFQIHMPEQEVRILGCIHTARNPLKSWK